MFPSAGLATLLTLGLLIERVATVPAPRNGTASVQSTGFQPTLEISWSSCESFGVTSAVTNLQCAYLEVPMDYHNSSAGNARLAVIKLAATAKKLGTVFFNPGGPGGSGLAAVSELTDVFTQGLRGAFDVISWDPRGVGYTFPGYVYCNSTEGGVTFSFWQNTPASYINETISGKFNNRDSQELYSQVNSTEQKFKVFTTRCQNGPVGPYLKYLGTSSTVRDLVSLGDAILGIGKPISYWGVSYGTILGFNFVNMFPGRVGSVILDGVVDPTEWITYKVMNYSLTDVEKTYSGLTDGCAKAGKAGCNLLEFTGDNATGDDVKAFVNYIHDLTLELYRGGFEVPLSPGLLKVWLYNLLYAPTSWSQNVNNDFYRIALLVLQTAQANNVTIPGGKTYNVPEGFAIDKTLLSLDGASPVQGLTPYSLAAISGADDFGDSNTKIKDMFDIIVEITRSVTPTFGTIWSLGYSSYKWPTRSVEKLLPYSPAKLKNPVLIIGNTADPITPLASAQKTANLLGNNAFLIEQLGFGHSSLAQTSSCTLGAMYDYLVNATLPKSRSTQCSIDDPNLFPSLDGTGATTVTRRLNFLRRRW